VTSSLPRMRSTD